MKTKQDFVFNQTLKKFSHSRSTIGLAFCDGAEAAIKATMPDADRYWIDLDPTVDSDGNRKWHANLYIQPSKEPEIDQKG